MSPKSLIALLMGGAVASAAVPGSGAADDEFEDLSPASIHLERDEVVVPMESWGGRPAVRARIDGKGPFLFILDTGASGGVIAPATAESLGLESLRDVTIMSPGSATPLRGSIVRVRELRLGGLVAKEGYTSAIDLSGVFGSPDAPAGVLSAAGFPGVLVTLDFPRKQVRFREGSLPSADGREVFAYGADPGMPPLPVVPVRLGDVEFHAVLDTGAPHVLLLPEVYEEKVRLRDGAEDAAHGRTLDQVLRVRKGRALGTLRLGRYSWEDPEVAFSQMPLPNVGMGILAEFEVTLDAAAKRIRVHRP